VGVLFPYLFRLIRIDPAIATGPFVTTAEDIIATSIYYLLALAILAR
jgi:magnesium transporter